MREIKFRVWDMTCKQMHINVQFGSVLGVLTFGDLLQNQTRWKLMQFTGLKDKNGKEIYEGDIVADSTYRDIIVGWSKALASFSLGRNGWAFNHWFGESMNPEDCEVIGNIYEHPELLKARGE